MVNNFVFSKKMVSLLLAGACGFSLIGCAESKVDDSLDSSSSTIQSENDDSFVLSDSSLADEYDKISGDDAVSAAITVMIDSVDYLDSSFDEYKDSSEYQLAKDEVVSNFDTIFGFLFNNKEIDGYTISDISDSTKEMAKDALYTLDSYIEKNIPDYKDSARDKLESAGAWIWDKSTDLGAAVVSGGSKWLDELESKIGEKSR